jgi:hypothetical protein
MTDELRRLLELQNEYRRITDPLGDVKRHMESFPQNTVQTAIAELQRAEEERRKVLADVGVGGIGKLIQGFMQERSLAERTIGQAARLGMFDPTSDLHRSISESFNASQAFDGLFRLPEISELGGLAHQGIAQGVLAREMFQAETAVQAAMGAMNSPWLQIEGTLASAKAFSGLLAIGRAVDVRPAFDPDLVIGLRAELGDWRDAISFEKIPLIDPISRSGLYLDLGFDPDLTNFTPAAFEESLELAGLRVGDPADDEGEAGLSRARMAFDQLQRFEVEIRRFIVQVMQAAFGHDWMKARLPPNMLPNWVEKRDKAVAGGQAEQPLIDYADFTDYRLIIERKDNWNTVFKPVFGRVEDVRESFQRLFPVRIATMHARLITQEDQLLLLVETRRVLKAIGAE